MNRWRRTKSEQAVGVRATTGDFPHTRRRSLRLACCTCTCCCFTFLLGSIGGVTGLVIGLVKAFRTPTGMENPIAALAVGVMRLVVFVAVYGIAGILIGAALGFGIDIISGVW